VDWRNHDYEGNKLIKPKTDQEDAAERKSLETLASPKWWPPENLKQLGVFLHHLRRLGTTEAFPIGSP